MFFMNTHATTTPLSSHREVFVVRFWQETNKNDQWRTQIKHIGTGHTVALNDSQDLLAYLQKKMAKKNTPNLIACTS